MKKLFVSLFLISFLFGCASSGRDGARKIRALLLEKKNEEALNFAKSDDFYREDKDRLLKLMELGRLHFINGNYYQALQSFDKSKETSDQLFTVSLSKKASTIISNDNADNYYGERYERSLIRYYQSLTHYMLYLKGKYESYVENVYAEDGKKISEKIIEEKNLDDSAKRFHLQAARSVLIEWDSLLSTFKSSTMGEATFKDDLIAKLYGALIHETLGSSNDLSIAKNLYKSAKDVLTRYYNLFPIYNGKSNEFRKDFEKLPNLSANEFKNYVHETEKQKELMDYIDDRLKALSGKSNQNIHFLIEDHLIEPKTAKVFDIPMPAKMVPAGIAQGDTNFFKFTLSVVGTGGELVPEPKFYYELPQLKIDDKTRNLKIEIKDNSGSVVYSTKAVLANPLSVIGHFSVEEKSSAVALSTGARILGKHLLALGSAYTLYQTQKEAMGEGLAMLGATATYQIASKGIEASEQADLRSWATIPRSLYLASASLKPGEYQMVVNEDGKVVHQEALSVSESLKIQIKNLQILE